MLRYLICSFAVIASSALAGPFDDLIPSNSAKGLTGENRQNFVSSASDSCYAQQRKNPSNASASNAALRDYCLCTSTYIADNLSANEVIDAYRGGDRTNFIQTMNDGAAKCRSKTALAGPFDDLIPRNSAKGMTGEIRQNFLANFIGGCYEQQRKSPANAAASNAVLRDYCLCASVYIADNASNSEVIVAERGGDRTNFVQIMNDGAAKCRSRLL